MKRRFTFDDAPAAAEVLSEISAGHEEAALAVLRAAGLDGLSNDELEELCGPVRRGGLGPAPLAEPASGIRARRALRTALPPSRRRHRHSA